MSCKFSKEEKNSYKISVLEGKTSKVVGTPREDARISDAQKNAERETPLQEEERKT
jgi:hypothetical protein